MILVIYIKTGCTIWTGKILILGEALKSANTQLMLNWTRQMWTFAFCGRHP